MTDEKIACNEAEERACASELGMAEQGMAELAGVAGGDTWEYVYFDSWKWENLR